LSACTIDGDKNRNAAGRLHRCTTTRSAHRETNIKRPVRNHRLVKIGPVRRHFSVEPRVNVAILASQLISAVSRASARPSRQPPRPPPPSAPHVAEQSISFPHGRSVRGGLSYWRSHGFDRRQRSSPSSRPSLAQGLFGHAALDRRSRPHCLPLPGPGGQGRGRAGSRLQRLAGLRAAGAVGQGEHRIGEAGTWSRTSTSAMPSGCPRGAGRAVPCRSGRRSESRHQCGEHAADERTTKTSGAIVRKLDLSGGRE
jgi:hypothetical protein